jgi:hypothetical protein
MEYRRIGSLLVTVSLLGLAGPRPGRAQAASPAPLVPGETLTYDVYWSIFPAGELVATLLRDAENGQAPDHIKTTARSQGFVSLLYNVRNEFHSYFDPQTLCSRRISKKIHEGRRRKETELVFDSARRLAILEERDLAKPGAPPKHAENEIPACVQDIITAFYYLRHRPLEVGKEVRVPVNDGSKTYEVSVEVQARERIQTPLGERTAFRLEPKVFEGLYKRKGRMLIWMSDDAERLPLRIKAMITVGSITGDLRAVRKPSVASPAAHP